MLNIVFNYIFSSKKLILLTKSEKNFDIFKKIKVLMKFLISKNLIEMKFLIKKTRLEGKTANNQGKTQKNPRILNLGSKKQTANSQNREYQTREYRGPPVHDLGRSSRNLIIGCNKSILSMINHKNQLYLEQL